MNNIKKLIICLFLSLGLYTQAQKKVAIVLMDGIPADILERAETPNLDKIGALGGRTKAYVGGIKNGYSQSPTVSAVGYNHLFTGVWSNKHNVYDNGIEDPNYRYPSIFRLVKDAAPSNTLGSFATWTAIRTKLIGENREGTKNLKIDYVADGYETDTVRFPRHIEKRLYAIDELVVNKAMRTIETNAPDLTWIYLNETDDAGHTHGDGQEMMDAVQQADEQVGRIWEVIQERMKTTGEEWMLFVTTDHGRSPKDGKGHGGQTDRERTNWFVTNYAQLNEHFYEQPAMVDVLPSIMRFMEIDVQEQVLMEFDGVPFIGKVSLSDFKAEMNDGQIDLTWKTLNDQGTADIYLSTTNNFKYGNEDKYHKVDSVPVKTGSYSFVPDSESEFYKIMIKGQYNWSNYWIVRD